jgi:hypothetical protein
MQIRKRNEKSFKACNVNDNNDNVSINNDNVSEIYKLEKEMQNRCLHTSATPERAVQTNYNIVRTITSVKMLN